MVKRWRLTARANLDRPDSNTTAAALYLIDVLRAYLVTILAGAVLVHVSGRRLELSVQLDLIIDTPPFLLLLHHLLVFFELQAFIFFVNV